MFREDVMSGNGNDSEVLKYLLGGVLEINKYLPKWLTLLYYKQQMCQVPASKISVVIVRRLSDLLFTVVYMKAVAER